MIAVTGITGKVGSRVARGLLALPRIRMVDGFNEGWIDFESGQRGSRKASTTLQAALQALVSESQEHSVPARRLEFNRSGGMKTAGRAQGRDQTIGTVLPLSVTWKSCAVKPETGASPRSTATVVGTCRSCGCL
jgi:hypothetical protein